jgi:hypothetical protein
MGMNMAQVINQNMNATNVDAADKLRKLKELLELGAITKEEFDNKKREYLKQL